MNSFFSTLFDTDTLKEVWSSITRNRRRSILTAFGVFWGMFMLVVMISMGKGIDNGIMGQINSIPSNMTICWTSSTSIPWQGFRKGRWWEMKTGDIDALRKGIPEITMIAPQVGTGSVKVVNKDKSGMYRVKGVDSKMSNILPVNITEGRYVNDRDVMECRKVCVMGSKIVDEIYYGKSPVGKYVKVGGINYQCIGIIERKNENMNVGGNDDESITVPYTTVQKLYNRGEDIDVLIIRANDETPIKFVEDRIRETICSRHQICPQDKKAMSFMNIDEELQTFRNLITGIAFLLWIVGLGTLLSGAIGVSNIVMITVKERTNEIGIRRAIGAKPGSILAQIMSESLIITCTAGLAGFTVGTILMAIIGKNEIKLGDGSLTLINPLISFNTAVASLVIIIVIGLLAGILPASRAMKIKAIDAIREE